MLISNQMSLVLIAPSFARRIVWYLVSRSVLILAPYQGWFSLGFWGLNLW